MHIGFITSHFPFPDSTSVGGIGTSINNLAIELVRSGHQVSIFVYGQSSGGKSTRERMTIYKIQKKKFKIFSGYFIRKYLQKKVNEIIDTEKIDVFEAPDWTGITAFMRLNAPLVIRFHGSDAYFCHLEQRKQKIKNFLLEKLAIRNADAFIAPTTFAGMTSATIFNIKLQKIRTIHYGLLLDRFNNNSPNEYEHGLILYVGAIIRKKGVLELPGIFKHVIQRVPDAKLMLLGSDARDIATGNESTWQLVQTKLDNQTIDKVAFLGNIPYETVQTYMKKAHICVFPTFAETLGMVTIEAMALRKPVVTSNFGWTYELIEDGKSGFLCDPENHASFADKVVTLLQNRQLCESIGEAARQRVHEKFNIVDTAEQNIKFYSQVINKEI